MKNKVSTVSLVSVIISLLIGLSVVYGWYTHNDYLTAVVPGLVRMKFNLALGFIFLSIALLIQFLTDKTTWWRYISVSFVVLVILIGLLTLIEYGLGLSLHIDELFVRDELRNTVMYFPGRMSPLSAINLVLLGIGFFLLDKEQTATYQFFYLSGVAFISFLMLIGFNYMADVPAFIRLGIHAGVGFIAFVAAIYYAQPFLEEKVSFEIKLYTRFTAVIILIAVISVFFAYYRNKGLDASHMVDHTNTILNETEQTLSLAKDIGSGVRMYLTNGDSSNLEYFMTAKENIFPHIDKIRALTIDNPAQLMLIDSLIADVNVRINFSDQCLQVGKEKGFAAADKLLMSGLGKIYTDRIRDIISQIQDNEHDLLAKRRRENEKSISSFNRAFNIFLGCVFILLVVILDSIRSNISTRKNAEAALTRMNSDLEQTVKDRTAELYQLNQELEERVKQRTAQLQAVNKELESFSYTVSHDLRAPLRGIHGYTQILQEDYGKKLDGEADRIMNVIMANTKKMGQLIDDLLSFSRYGRAELKKVTISMQQLVTGLCDEMKDGLNGQAVEFKIADLYPAMADSSAIRQVWVNLISNAIKYSRHSKPSLVQIGSVENESEIIYFLRDNGVGFDMRYIDKLFGVFQRLHSMDEFEGTGVGLAIVQRIVQKHGGRVWAEGKVDEGATFYFSLPKNKTI